MSQGYIKLHRKIQDNWVWDEKANNASAWTDLLLMAAWSPTQKHINGQIYQLERGEIVASLRYFSNKWGWTKNKVGRFFDKLEKTGMITTKRDTQITHLTICNYDTYNSPEISNGTTPGHERDSDFQKVYKKRDTQKPPQPKEPQQVTRHKKNKTGQQRDSNGTASDPKAGQIIKKKEVINNIVEGKDEKDMERLLERLEKRKAVKHLQDVIDIVDYFNKFAGKSVKYSTDQALKYILDHLIEGRSVEMVKGVIWHKVQSYNEMDKRQYIALPTILRHERFEQAFEEAKERKQRLTQGHKSTEKVENPLAKRIYLGNGKFK